MKDLNTKVLIFIIGLLITADVVAFEFNQLRDLLEDLKEKAVINPLLIRRPDGGYIVLWAEEERYYPLSSLAGTEPEPLEPYEQILHYYYRVIAPDGKLTVDKMRLTTLKDTQYRFTQNGALWISADSLLIVYQRCFMHSRLLGRFIFDSSGNIISGPDPSKIYLEPNLVRNSKGRIYAIDPSPLTFSIQTAQVYPQFGRVKTTSKDNAQRFAKKFARSEYLFIEPVYITTSKDNLLICSGLNWQRTFSLEEALEWRGWDRSPYKIWYIHTDLEGNFISNPVELDLTKDAFRKIPGIHLGGAYYPWMKHKGAENAMDLSKLPNGEIILSVAGLDEKENLCVYQVRFTPEGELIKPERMEVVEPYPWPIDRRLPVVKVRFIDTGIEVRGGFKEIQGRRYPKKVFVRSEYILYGFDEEGNFYEDRFVWEEREW